MKKILLVIAVLFSGLLMRAQNPSSSQKPGVEIKKEAGEKKMKKDGTPDRRFKENKKLKKDGTPDLRYKENKEKASGKK